MTARHRRPGPGSCRRRGRSASAVGTRQDSHRAGRCRQGGALRPDLFRAAAHELRRCNPGARPAPDRGIVELSTSCRARGRVGVDGQDLPARQEREAGFAVPYRLPGAGLSRPGQRRRIEDCVADAGRPPGYADHEPSVGEDDARRIRDSVPRQTHASVRRRDHRPRIWPPGRRWRRGCCRSPLRRRIHHPRRRAGRRVGRPRRRHAGRSHRA
jgi:hypothetical protein